MTKTIVQRMASRRSVMKGMSASAVALMAKPAVAQSVEVAYNTFLDPANATDPRAAAQTRMIAAFEQANPNIKVKVIVDPSGANGLRAARAKADSPDVIRATTFQVPEFASTGSILPIDELVARDKIDLNDWLIPLEQTRVNGKLWGLQQDFRVPVLIYRKSRFAEAQVAAPPRTYAEVGALGPKLTKDNVMAFGIPLGVTEALAARKPSWSSSSARFFRAPRARFSRRMGAAPATATSRCS